MATSARGAWPLLFLLALPATLWLLALTGAVSFDAVLAKFWAPNESTILYEISSLLLSPEQEKSLKDLGLTKKDPVQIKDPLTGEKKVIHGRFLHITDLHPDPHYKEGSKVDRLCHGGKGDAGKYGDAILGCDAPMRLVQETLDWVEANLKDKIDFIVWTGDNMRHDNDRNYPRTETDIFDLNEQIASAMHDKFGALPVPSLGNNDVYPHNLFAPGPTLQTREFFKIWRPFIPQLQMHTFNRGAYFFQEVIPNQLAVLSINTLYLFQSNPLVDNCDRKKDPGYMLFKWLGVVLKEMRRRNMKVWLTGHVPPNAKNYDISCLRKYIAWSYEYRDIIVGGLYGHMNIDHFIPLDSVTAFESLNKKFGSLGYHYDVSEFENGMDLDDELLAHQELLEDELHFKLEELYDFHNSTIHADSIDANTDFDVSFSNDVWVEGGVPSGKVGYMNSLRESFYAAIKKKKRCGEHSERYSIAHVTASVVPTFNPGLRVWEYNITDLHNLKSTEAQGWDVFFSEIDHMLTEETDNREYNDAFVTFQDKVEMLKKDKTFPPKMPKDLPLGPAYVPQLFTPERYVQYYVDLRELNKGNKEFEYEIEYTTDNGPFQMRDLTVAQWLKLGRKLGEPIKDEKKKKKKESASTASRDTKLAKLWESFLTYNFVSSDYENLGYG